MDTTITKTTMETLVPKLTKSQHANDHWVQHVWALWGERLYYDICSWDVAFGEEEVPDEAEPLDNRFVCASTIAAINYNLWHREDFCRTYDDKVVAANKRLIDVYNQRRNDRIAQFDELVLREHVPGHCCQVSSETLGSIVDRLSITMLKYFHTAQLYMSGNELRLKMGVRLEILRSQVIHLAECADRLDSGLANGTMTFVTFNQLKMYNSSLTNPKMANDGEANHKISANQPPNGLSEMAD
jgi:hypothetical protein